MEKVTITCKFIFKTSQMYITVLKFSKVISELVLMDRNLGHLSTLRLVLRLPVPALLFRPSHNR